MYLTFKGKLLQVTPMSSEDLLTEDDLISPEETSSVISLERYYSYQYIFTPQDMIGHKAGEYYPNRLCLRINKLKKKDLIDAAEADYMNSFAIIQANLKVRVKKDDEEISAHTLISKNTVIEPTMWTIQMYKSVNFDQIGHKVSEYPGYIFLSVIATV